MSSAAAQTTQLAASRGWLWGAAPDLLLGCGVAYLISIPILIWALPNGGWPVLAVSGLALFVSGPHYGATILRVYEKRHDRKRYAVFAVWITAGLVGLFYLGLHNVLVGSLLLTLYLSWAPWHFAGQNYGLGLMFLRRRGVPISSAAKRLLWLSFFLSFVLSFLAIHAGGAAQTVPGHQTVHFEVLRLGLPSWFLDFGMPLAFAAYLLSLASAILLLKRGAGLADLVPMALLALMQALWFIVPAVLPEITKRSVHALPFTAVWVSTAHAIQYLWITSYYAHQADARQGLRSFFTRALLAGGLVNAGPALLFAPALLGTLPYDAGLAILVFSVVNLHHFVLDGAIWKLRDGRVARLLLGTAPDPTTAHNPSGPSGWSWGWPVAGTIGAVSLAIAVVDVWGREVELSGKNLQIERLLKVSDRLHWFGRESASMHLRAGRMLQRKGKTEQAIAQYRRSLEVAPSAQIWSDLGHLHFAQGDWSQAVQAFGAALELDPRDEVTRRNLSAASLNLATGGKASR